ncbi:hypothetical protein M0802_006265 [Mischocyttarus mexicanus]|nr:hypothetical protein M0802_006265 [Mischocyttarus mexicanus]
MSINKNVITNGDDDNVGVGVGGGVGVVGGGGGGGISCVVVVLVVEEKKEEEEEEEEEENKKQLLRSCVRHNVVSEFLRYAAEGQGSSSLACQSSAGYSQLFMKDSNIF